MFFCLDSHNAEALSKAMKKCAELMVSGGHKEIGLVVPQLSNLQGYISEAFGDEAVRILSKKRVIVLSNGTIRLFTKRNPPRFTKYPLLVAYVPVKQMTDIVKDCPGADVVFVPWSQPEKDQFITAYGADLVQ